MKIVYVSKSVVPSRTANSIHVMNICSALAAMGHEVTILLPDAEEQRAGGDVFSFYGLERTFEVKKLYYPAYKGKTIYFSIAVYLELRRIKPDLVIGRFLNGCFVATQLRIPVVFDTHGPIWEDSRISTYIFKKMLGQRSLKRITVNSNALKKIYQASGYFANTRYKAEDIVVAHNGANDYDLSVKAALPGRASSLKVGYFGHLYAGRGVEMIIALAAGMPHVDFYIAGGEETDIEFWKLKSSLKNLYFLGFITFGEVYKYRNACDILLAPYQKVVSPGGEAADQAPYMNPIKILEYMSSRKAIVCSDLPTTREVLNETNAVLVEYDNAAQWENALAELERNEELRHRLAQNAYERFLTTYTWKKRAETLIEGIL